MIQNYEEAVHWIHGRLRLGIKPGLERMEWMMNRLGNPHLKIKAVHIGGTNGKGSTLSFLRQILQEDGYSVGTFTSPYFEFFNERISVNGYPAPEEEWTKLVNKIKPLADELEQHDLGGPTEFEVITAMMFYYFGEMKKVDIALIEVGLGGRFDSTNIVQPVCTCITSIGLDHVSILGNSYEEIAFEKAGIIKDDIPLVLNVNHNGARGVIIRQAEKMRSSVYELGRQFHIAHEQSNEQGEKFVYNGTLHLKTAMSGLHQAENASLAVTIARLIKPEMTDQVIQTGLQNTYWPGRFELISQDPLIVMDGAHNPEGIEMMMKTIQEKYSDKKVHFIFAAVSDKDLSQMIGVLDHHADKITFTSFDFPRAAKSDQLYELSSHHNKKTADQRDWITEIKRSNDILYMVTGSLYFLSGIYRELKKIHSN
ncbi:bifunctional folylpolyglutamate synthase/dihydrofolate synthase [Jeotgalibacillus salarius]|uniref:Dihydrofolate synthase/folylpolyglutamate synthase n=1 Tax=Jeotgalibacillus salarius TaxID=546023 RepID=A0A4Y8LFK5_9BACL|nr:folylpolyglutamate synthase/dihydrofolate synthase family protein [Jeotgalibacillus salarius]TFE01006.1 bifunctional folylpolyglutamate synthase/dihydrofolate synthase [Jeotgalibacillus salarius]